MIIHNPVITGSFQVNGTSVSSIGQVDTISESVDTLNSATSSYALKNSISGAFDMVSSSLASRVASQESFSSSLDATFATDADLNLVSSSVDSLNAATSSYALKTEISGSFTSLSASLSTRLTDDEGSITSLNAATSSYLQNTTDTLTGDLTVTGTLTAQDLHVQEITSSIVYSSGSNIFGNDSTNTHTFTGTGSFDAVGIGTANPSTTLDINGGFKWNGVATLTDLAYFVGSSTYGFRFNTAADDYNNVIFYDDGKSYFRGSVGIGTTSPENYYTGADNLVIYQSSGEAGITVATADDTTGALYFADGTTGDAQYRGGIAYTNSTEVLSLVSGGSTKMVISGSGNVGIASNSPNYRLEVKGNNESIIASIDHNALTGRQVGLPHRFMIGGISNNYPEIGYNYTTQNSTYTKISEDTAWAIHFGANSRMSFKYAASGTGAFSFTELAVINSDGNVGIGTYDPSAKLHLYVDSANHDTLHIFNGSVRTHLLGSESSNGVIYMRSSSNTNTVRINASGYSYFNGGNVGIGTTSPSAKLHIADTTTMTSGQSSVEVLKLQRLDSGGDIKASTEGHISMWATDSNNDNEWARISWVNDNTSDGGLENEGALSFWTNTNGTLNRAMYIDHDQNVGIGISSPATKLNLVQGSNIRVNSDSANPSTFLDYYYNASYNHGLAVEGDRGLRMFSQTGDTSAKLTFYTEGSERMRITSGGYILTGARTSATGGWGAGSIEAERGVGAFNGNKTIYLYNNGTDIKLDAYDYGTSTALDITIAQNGGSVGIGTTSPDERLHVNGNVAAINSSYPTIKVQDSDVNYQGRMRWDTNNNVLEFLTRHAGVYYSDTLVLKQGEVGIGTNAPDGKLHIYGSATTGNIRIGGGNGSGNSRVFIESNGDNSYIDSYGDDAYKHLYIQANRLLLNTAANTGNVGIGVTNPQADLDVDQDLRVNRYHKNVFSYYTTNSASNQYFHIKTGVGTNQVCMHMYHVEGYAYGVNDIIDERFGFHTDSGGSVYGKSYKGTYANNIYKSSDSKVVIVFGPINTYYTSFMVHLIESGMYSELFVKPSAATYSSSNSGAY